MLTERPRSADSQVRNSSTSSGVSSASVGRSTPWAGTASAAKVPPGQGKPMIVLASMMAPAAIMAATSSTATRSIVMASSSTPSRCIGTSVRSARRTRTSARRRSPASCRTRPAARAGLRRGRPPRPARVRAVVSGGSPSHVALAGGDLEQVAVERGAVLAHQHDSSSISGTTETAPGWCTTSRSNGSPSGPTNVPTPSEITAPSKTSPRWIVRVADRLGDSTRSAPAVAVELDEVRVAALGPAQGGADELAEQRRRPVGAALELGVGLGADPERVALELDELDQATVGRRARAARSRRPRSGRGTWC